MAYNVLFSNVVGELDDLVVEPSYASVFPNPVQECKPVTVSYRPNNGPLWDATNVTAIINPGVDIEREMQDLLLIEQAFAANARVLEAASQMINQLMEL